VLIIKINSLYVHSLRTLNIFVVIFIDKLISVLVYFLELADNVPFFLLLCLNKQDPNNSDNSI